MSYNNMFLIHYGLNPDEFEDEIIDPVPYKNGFIICLKQKRQDFSCPYCGCYGSKIDGNYTVEIKSQDSSKCCDILRIKKVRMRCPHCGKTFTPELEGLTKRAKVSNQTVNCILNEFTKKLTFQHIAESHGLTANRVIQLFDSYYRFATRLKLPKIVCIDELGFKVAKDSKYVCVLTDFKTGQIIDVLPSRQMAYLREYFGNIPLKERENIKIFLSDMYDAYDTICVQYLPNAIHIVDLFHVVQLLTVAVNKVRTMVMNKIAKPKSPEYNFMKSHWSVFLKPWFNLKPKEYKHQKTKCTYTTDEIISMCLNLNADFYEAYNILQELFGYSSYSTFDEALDFINRISNRLDLCDHEMLKKAGKSFHKWRVEIANGFNKRERPKRYTNALAENMNNHIRTLIKVSYGLHNFERFRKRILLISREKKDAIRRLLYSHCLFQSFVWFLSSNHTKQQFISASHIY